MPDHLLNLNALHAAAPGVLDAIFGPDGHHPGAPSWIGAVSDYKRRRVMPMTFVMLFSLDDTIDENYVLDCRVPSVAARLLGLCARAMDSAATGAAWIEDHGDSVALRYCATRVIPHDAIYWKRATGAPYATAVDAKPVVMAEVLFDGASFIAALVTALAPRIAALGGGR